MKKKLRVTLILLAMIFGLARPMMISAFAADPATVFVHDPRFNSTAMEDVLVDLDAVYGFRPDPESAGLGSYADRDWSDTVMVEQARNERIAYHESMSTMYDTAIEMKAAGASTEEIARKVSTMRNELRIASYKDDPEGLAAMKERNLAKYGNEDGPTPDSVYESKGSWEAVIGSAFNTNPGMDACLGIYDDNHEYYILFGQITGDETEIMHQVEKNETLQTISLKYYGTPDKWQVIYNDNRDKIKNADLINIGDVLSMPR